MGFSLFDDECCCCQDPIETCNNCICVLLRETPKGTRIKLVTDSRDILEGVFLGFIKGNCIKLCLPEMVSPYEPKEEIFIDCNKVESVAFLLES